MSFECLLGDDESLKHRIFDGILGVMNRWHILLFLDSAVLHEELAHSAVLHEEIYNQRSFEVKCVFHEKNIIIQYTIICLLR
jgi:hypothetical protein